MEVEGVYAVTGSLWLRCLVYHNTRPSVRGSADAERMRRDPPPRNGSNVSEDRENRVVDGSRPLKGRAANTRDILSWPPLRVLPVLLLHDVERNDRENLLEIVPRRPSLPPFPRGCSARIRCREEDGQVGGTSD